MLELIPFSFYLDEKDELLGEICLCVDVQRPPIKSDLSSENTVHNHLASVNQWVSWRTRGKQKDTQRRKRKVEGLWGFFDSGSGEGQDHVLITLWIAQVYSLIFTHEFYFFNKTIKGISISKAFSKAIKIISSDRAQDTAAWSPTIGGHSMLL